MSLDCVVITGSHNQGFRASYANDENFIIVRAHQPLAQAYATHVMDVYDHYRWRFTLKTTCLRNAFSGLDPTPAWQEKYYSVNSVARRELLLWTGQLPALPAAPAPAVPTTSAMAKLRSKGKAKQSEAKARAKGKNAPTEGAKEAPVTPFDSSPQLRPDRAPSGTAIPWRSIQGNVPQNFFPQRHSS